MIDIFKSIKCSLINRVLGRYDRISGPVMQFAAKVANFNKKKYTKR